jgi:pyruvyltransferase
VTMKKLTSLFLSVFLLSALNGDAFEDSMFWSVEKNNFGDQLSQVIVERIIDRPVKLRGLDSKHKILLSLGSILNFARNGDVVWGTGFRSSPVTEKRFRQLDVRAVSGPVTRDYLLQLGIECPEVYGDPAILMAHLFPELKKKAKPKYNYIIIPDVQEVDCLGVYQNVVMPTLPWDEVVELILDSKLVISSSLHGIIVAESFGVPARMLKMTWAEPLLKFQDYYQATGRPNLEYATSVAQALKMGGAPRGNIDPKKLLEAFPWDYFNE